MFESGRESSVLDALARLDVALDEVVDLDVAALSRDGLLDLLSGLERTRRRSATVDHLILAELDRRRTAVELGYRDPAALLCDLLRITPGEARMRVRSAAVLGPRRATTGEPGAPAFPAVAAAEAEGAVSAGHGRVIVEAVASLPAYVERHRGRAVERLLVGHARRLDPSRLAIIARRVVDTLDPEGTRSSDLDKHHGRNVTLTPNRDGTGNLRARMTPECFAVWQAVLGPLAEPRPADAGGPDARSPGHRVHDALLDAGRRIAASGALPSPSGMPATVIVTMTLDQLEARSGVVTTAHGGALSVAEALRIADEANVVPAVLGTAGGVLAYGRASRVATSGQRLALLARDGGCSFPGCGTPAWDDVHHVVPWDVGGKTDVSNMTLLCAHHHREFAKRGWSVSMARGVPEWVPPSWIDPEQRPIRPGGCHPVAAR